MPNWLDLLVLRTWWRYNPRDNPCVWQPYHWFNLFEGCVWLILAGFVVRRAVAGRRSVLEGCYALAFATFGVTDFREAYALSSWLIWLKLINLIALWRLRAVVLRRYYPQSKLY